MPIHSCRLDQVGWTLSDLFPSLLYKINQTQLALEAAIMELTLWVERRGSAEVAGYGRGALDTISENARSETHFRLIVEKLVTIDMQTLVLT